MCLAFVSPYHARLTWGFLFSSLSFRCLSVCLRDWWDMSLPHRLLFHILNIATTGGWGEGVGGGSAEKAGQGMVKTVYFSEPFLDSHPFLQLLFKTNLQHSEFMHEPSYSLLHWENLEMQSIPVYLRLEYLNYVFWLTPLSDFLVRQAPS